MTERPSLWATLFTRRMLACVFTGFSSGLPLYLLLNLVPAWLRTEGISLKTIGAMALIQFPYTWKFLWAPLLDRYAFPGLGRRRGWMLFTQSGLLLLVGCMGFLSPTGDLSLIVYAATGVALLSATLDIALDAYRRELLSDGELGLGNAVHVNAYRIAGLVPGSLSLILADHLPWTTVFLVTAGFIVPGIVLALVVAEPTAASAPRSLREAVAEPFREFWHRRGWSEALLVLAFIFFYKLGDSMCTALATPFYLDMGYSKSDIGLIAKNAGLWPSVVGGLLGGLWLVKLGVNRGLWVFGVVQVVTILGFAWLARLGPFPEIGAFERLSLALVIGGEALGVGLGTAAFVAYLATLTHPAYTATQFALFTSLAATPRTLANALAGFLVEGGDIPLGQIGIIHFAGWGWQTFFWVCFGLALPGLLLLLRVGPDQ